MPQLHGKRSEPRPTRRRLLNLELVRIPHQLLTVAPIQPDGDSTGAVMDPNSIDALISEAAGDSESTPSETQVGNDRKSGLLSKLFKKRDDSGTSVPAGASASAPASAPAGEMAATDAPTTPAPSSRKWRNP